MLNAGICMLDQALELAHREMEALGDEDYGLAVKLAEQRSEITSMAWRMLASGCDEGYRNRLLALSELQVQLAEKASQAQESLRADLQQARRQRQRIRGYHQAVGQALQ